MGLIPPTSLAVAENHLQLLSRYILLKRPLLIDTDAAADDLLALLLALAADHFSIESITVVSGACRADQGVQNVKHLLHLAKRETLVFVGRDRPLFGPLRDSTHIMGSDGLGGQGPDLGQYPYEETPACDEVRRFIRENPNECTIVCLGPLTNVALALASEPALAKKIGQLVVMGGVADGIGNITPAAEFNIWADPEAAKLVFESGVVFDLLGWDVSRNESSRFSPGDLDKISAVGTDVARFGVSALLGLRTFLSQKLGMTDVDLPDPLAMAVALYPETLTGSVLRHVSIDTSTGPSRGATIVDHLQVTDLPKNARIITGVNKAIVLDKLCQAVDV